MYKVAYEVLFWRFDGHDFDKCANNNPNLGEIRV